jgi:hypothetical protein
VNADRCECLTCAKRRARDSAARLGEFIRVRAGDGPVVFLTLTRSKAPAVVTVADLERAWERFRGVHHA